MLVGDIERLTFMGSNSIIGSGFLSDSGPAVLRRCIGLPQALVPFSRVVDLPTVICGIRAMACRSIREEIWSYSSCDPASLSARPGFAKDQPDHGHLGRDGPVY